MVANAKKSLSVLFQMAVWIPSSQKIFVAPAPVATVPSSDEYITRTNLYYHANSERLLTVGHPLFQIKEQGSSKVLVPKVSGSQYRVFRVQLPDPNKFAVPEPSLYDPDKERLVWLLRGVEVGRGGPLGMGITGNVYFGRRGDAENPNTDKSDLGGRLNVALEPKQTQMIIVGCSPAQGEHWDKAVQCADVTVSKGDCPPIELVSSVIEDGDMIDTGFGHLNFKSLQEDKSGTPLDIVNSKCKYPDFLQMSKDAFGNSCFFCVRKEQTYTRHYFTKSGVSGDSVPSELTVTGTSPGTTVYMGTPSGSIVTTEGQVLNRPYWLLKGQGLNNGALWNNRCFVTVVDNTRGLNFSISMLHADSPSSTYAPEDYHNYLRHTEEYELSFILQIGVVSLTPETLSLLHTMDPSILDGWEIGVNPAVSGHLTDDYRFIHSLATRCPDKQAPAAEKKDPLADLQFWLLDFTERLSTDLSQFPLGRRFLSQIGRRTVKRAPVVHLPIKRKAVSSVRAQPKSVARRRKR